MKRQLTPFEMGFKAYGERKGITDNPFAYVPAESDPTEKSNYWQWYAGWRKADRENGN